MALVCCAGAWGHEYDYAFAGTPLSEALIRVSKDHPDVSISFIYKELDSYRTSARIDTDDLYEALRQIVGFNPVSVVRNGDRYYIEALQHGRFRYTGQVVDRKDKPIAAATVMLLAPADSSVITYGITDSEGRFDIPCDRTGVLGKFSCVGYGTRYEMCGSFAVGTVTLKELPIRLHGVSVESDIASLMPDKSIYRPTQRQKNASQTATELLVRMAIPQLNTRLGSSEVSTVSGEPVAMYIDYVPATADELRMMRTTDVRSVEYLDYPADPRFQGHRHVINFRMVRYEYGGYVKVLGTGNFIANSGFAQANARLVRHRMTYDVMGYGYYMSNDHFGADRTETFSLPQPDGEVKHFERTSLTEASKLRRHSYETSARALYTTDNVTANSQIGFGLDDTPHNDNSGSVRYTGNVMAPSEYASVADSRAGNLSYKGYYYFGLPCSSALTASADYSYSHTAQNSRYTEAGMPAILNGARDNTHDGNMTVSYNRSFSDRHSLTAHLRGLYEHNRTRYSGSVDALDNSSTTFAQTGASYNFTNPKVSASAGLGWDWMWTSLNDTKSYSDFPYLDLSVNYAPDKRNSLGAVFHYSVWPPSANYKSENLIHVSPFLWHTGNPRLKSHRSYDIWLNYTFIPSNRFNMSVYTGAWLVGDRAAFVYEATPEGIIRTLRQPIGGFGHYNSGVKLSTRQLDGKLYLSGNVEWLYVHNGAPYNVDRSRVSYYLQALYYIGGFNFALSYQSASATDNYDCMSGVWTSNKDRFTIQAGWSNATWNIRLSAQNPQRWNWRSSHDSMASTGYSTSRWMSDASGHAFVQLSATYTFGFGRKVKHGNDISRRGGASSGILK